MNTSVSRFQLNIQVCEENPWRAGGFTGRQFSASNQGWRSTPGPHTRPWAGHQGHWNQARFHCAMRRTDPL